MFDSALIYSFGIDNTPIFLLYQRIVKGKPKFSADGVYFIAKPYLKTAFFWNGLIVIAVTNSRG